MRLAGRLAGEILDQVADYVRPGKPPAMSINLRRS
jgi:hypothetical protein